MVAEQRSQRLMGQDHASELKKDSITTKEDEDEFHNQAEDDKKKEIEELRRPQESQPKRRRDEDPPGQAIHAAKDQSQKEVNHVDEGQNSCPKILLINEILNQDFDSRSCTVALGKIIERMGVTEERVGLVHAHHGKVESRLKERVEELEAGMRQLKKNHG